MDYQHDKDDTNTNNADVPNTNAIAARNANEEHNSGNYPHNV